MISYFLWGERNCWSLVAFFPPSYNTLSTWSQKITGNLKRLKIFFFFWECFWVCYGISLPLPVLEEAKVPSSTWSQCACLEFLAWDDREIELYWYIVHFQPGQIKNACSWLGQERFPVYIYLKKCYPRILPKAVKRSWWRKSVWIQSWKSRVEASVVYLKTWEDRHYVTPAPRKLQWESHSNSDLENTEVAHESANVYLASEEEKMTGCNS